MYHIVYSEMFYYLYGNLRQKGRKRLEIKYEY